MIFPELPINIWFFVKLLFLFAIGIYLVFASVVVRQVYLMTSTIRMSFEFVAKMLVWLHLFLAIAVFLIALIIL